MNKLQWNTIDSVLPIEGKLCFVKEYFDYALRLCSPNPNNPRELTWYDKTHDVHEYLIKWKSWIAIDELENIIAGKSSEEKVAFDGKSEHYCAGGMEAIDVIEAYGLGFSLGNAVKYILRCGHKGGGDDAIRDLEKARAYIDREITRRKQTHDLEGLAKREAQG